MIHETTLLQLAQQRVMEFVDMSETPERLYFNGQQATPEQVDHFLNKMSSKFEYEITTESYMIGCAMYIVAHECNGICGFCCNYSCTVNPGNPENLKTATFN